DRDAAGRFHARASRRLHPELREPRRRPRHGRGAARSAAAARRAAVKKIGYHPAALASVDDFLTLDLRVGTVVAAEVLRGARKPAFRLQVDFGTLGKRTSSAQITDLYEPAELVGLQVVPG